MVNLEYMQVIVKNDDPIKAYKVLMKKLNKEGVFAELRKRKRFVSNTEKRRIRAKTAKIERKKSEVKRLVILERQEQFAMIESKRRSREARKNLKKGQKKS